MPFRSFESRTCRYAYQTPAYFWVSLWYPCTTTRLILRGPGKWSATQPAPSFSLELGVP